MMNARTEEPGWEEDNGIPTHEIEYATEKPSMTRMKFMLSMNTLDMLSTLESSTPMIRPMQPMRLRLSWNPMKNQRKKKGPEILQSKVEITVRDVTIDEATGDNEIPQEVLK